MYEAPKTPMPVGGVLDNGFSLFKAALKATFPIALAAALLTAPIGGAYSTAVANGTGGGWVLIGALAAMVIELVAWGAIIARIHAIARGETLRLGDALGIGLRRGPAFLLTGLLFGLAVAAGFLLLIVPGIYLTITLMFAMIAVVVEQTGPLASLKYSADLVRGNWWRTAVLATVIALIASVLYFLVGIVVGAVAASNPQAVIATGALPWYFEYIVAPLMSGVLVPLGYSLFMALYFDLKLRREGGDIAERIAAAGA
jgi:hypothetical protein